MDKSQTPGEERAEAILTLMDALHNLLMDSIDHGFRPYEAFTAEIYSMAVSIAAAPDPDRALAFVREELPALVAQLRGAEAWKAASRVVP